ncbi:ring finger protein 11a, partial [Silurus meridionalis]
ERVQEPVYHPTPSQTRLATQLTEEEQVRIAQRIGLIQHLPRGIFNPSDKKIKESVPTQPAQSALYKKIHQTTTFNTFHILTYHHNFQPNHNKHNLHNPRESN